MADYHDNSVDHPTGKWKVAYSAPAYGFEVCEWKIYEFTTFYK